jgi:hypothetical protein
VLKRKPEFDDEELCWAQKKRRVWSNTVRNLGEGGRSEKDILIIDTGGGRNDRVTSKAWKVLYRTSHKKAMSGYQDKSTPKVCPIVKRLLR